MPKNCDGGLLFRSEVKDGITLEKYNLSVCHFEHLGLKEAKFSNCKITQCLFSSVYLRLASFSDVDLTGTTFRNCNLDRATFQRCNFQYCRFENTTIDPDEIESCLPKEPNLRRDLARNLRKNFETLGDKAAADRFLNHEIKAEEDELWSRFRCKTSYYKARYTWGDRIVALGKWCGFKLSGIVWGHGYRIISLILSYVILTVLLAFVTFFCEAEFRHASGSIQILSLSEALYQSFAETLGSMTTPFIPESWFARCLQLQQRFVGTVMLALLVAAAYRRIAR